MKKIMSLLLIFVLLFGCGVSAFAADETDTMFYNGVELPVLPEYDKDMYPYFVICTGGNGAFSQLFVSSVPYFWSDSDRTLSFDSHSWCVFRFRPDSSTNWEVISTNVDKDSGLLSRLFLPFFSNYDIINDSDNTVYLAASEPSVSYLVSSGSVSSDMTSGVLDEILAVLPVVFVVLIGFIAIRKGIGFIKSSVKSS